MTEKIIAGMRCEINEDGNVIGIWNGGNEGVVEWRKAFVPCKGYNGFVNILPCSPSKLRYYAKQDKLKIV